LRVADRALAAAYRGFCTAYPQCGRGFDRRGARTFFCGPGRAAIDGGHACNVWITPDPRPLGVKSVLQRRPLALQRCSNRHKSAGQRPKTAEHGAFVPFRPVINHTGQSGRGARRRTHKHVGRSVKQMDWDSRSAMEAPLAGVRTGARQVRPGRITAAHRTFPSFPIFQPAAISTGFFVSTDRVDADPTDKG